MSVVAVREEEVKLRGVGFVKEVGFKPGVKERWSYRCTEWWIRRGRSDGWRNSWYLCLPRCDIAGDERRLPEARLFPWRLTHLQVQSLHTVVSSCHWTPAAAASVLSGKVRSICSLTQHVVKIHVYSSIAMAQRVEHWNCDQQVMGSIPTRGRAA